MNPIKSEAELRNEILVEFKQVYKLAPDDYTENCTNSVMSMVKREIEQAFKSGFKQGLGDRLKDVRIAEINTMIRMHESALDDVITQEKSSFIVTRRDAVKRLKKRLDKEQL